MCEGLERLQEIDWCQVQSKWRGSGAGKETEKWQKKREEEEYV